MPMGMLPYTLSLIIAAIFSITVAILSFRRRPTNGSIPLTVLMLCVGFWLICQTFQDISSNNALKHFWYNAKFIAIALISPTWLIFALNYSKQEKYINRKVISSIMFLPTLTLFFIVTNNTFHLMYKSVEFEKKGQINVVISNDGIWFWVHTYYSYLLVLISLTILLDGFIRLPRIYRKQAGILLVGSLLPLIGNILTIFKFIVLPYDDITPLALLISGILFFWALFRYKLMDLVPVAHRAVFQSIQDFVMVLDNQSRIIDLNATALKYIGEEESKTIGKNVTDVLQKWSFLIGRFSDVLETNEKIEIESEDKVKCFDLKISPVYDTKKRVTGRLFVLRDITDLEDAIKELKHSREIAEAANRSKSQFLANMSHEIRTPMNAIIGMADLMDATPLNVEQREYLSLIRSSSKSLLTIINDILDFSKIEAGKLEIEKIPFNIRELIVNTIEPLALQAKNKSLELIYTIDDSIPHVLLGDPTRLKQIMTNLIGNSIKFTPEDGLIEVIVGKSDNREVPESTVEIRFSVSDTGIGIPEEKINNLFQSFHQLDSTTTRKYGGTGLGLAIVKSLIEIMGGCIKVSSKYKVGSTFYFLLQFAIADPKTLNEAKSAVKTKNAYSSHDKSLHILLAEDNKVNQMLMSKIFEKQKKWSMDIAENGKKVLKLLEGKDYDLILMDVQMPEMDGFETTSIIRQNEAAIGSHIPIIALTANAMKGDRELCLEAGMDDYLSKPIRAEKLFELVDKYV